MKKYLRKAEKAHPLRTMTVFLVAGITMLFLTLIVLFACSHPAALLSGKSFPKAFILSTVVILFSSWTMERAKKAFHRDNSKGMLDWLMASLGLALVFSVLQYFGWSRLWTSGVTLYEVGPPQSAVRTSAGAFLFVISGLHLLHLAGGIIFLFLAMFKAVNARGDDVRGVVYFADRLERARVEMLVFYWHFLGGLWFLLFLYFLWYFV